MKEAFRFAVGLLSTLLLAAPSPALNENAKRIDKALLKGPVVSREIMANGRNRMLASILIHASPEIVWSAVHAERQHDPEIAYAKVLESANNKTTVEEKFVLLPVIGSATCIMQDSEVPGERIDYRLIKSDHFKAMEGSWVLTSYDGGQSTILALSSYLELGFPVPRMILDSITTQKLQKRLQNVKIAAERS